MNIALLGASGAGKGTQAAKLCPQFGFRHLSTGDLLRANLGARTALGLLARKYMDRGELVPDEVVEAMIEESLQSIPTEQGVLLDGFPRTPVQAESLDELFRRFGRHLDAVVHLHVEEAAVLSRLQGRLVCRGCHLPYHVQAKPPGMAGVCDVCGDVLQTRPDDHAEVARNRYKVFQRHNDALLRYYQPSRRLHLVDAGGSIDAVSTALGALLEALRCHQAAGATVAEIQRLCPAPVPVTAPTLTSVCSLVLLGGPGSGKGTRAEFLKQEFDLCHVATGDLFRENLKNATRLGQFAKSYMDRGELVPDDITEAMVAERLAGIDPARGFLLDGFPRTLPQADALNEMLATLGRPLGGVLFIQVADESLVARLSQRLICRACQASYHREFRPPARPDVCDQCGGELYQRDDDKPATVRARLATFHKQTQPLSDYYRRVGLLVEINGEGDLASVNERTLAAVRALRPSTREEQRKK